MRNIDEKFTGRNGYQFRPHGTLYVDALNTVTDRGVRIDAGMMEDIEQHFLAKCGFYKTSNGFHVARAEQFEVDSDMAVMVHDDGLKPVGLRWSNLSACECGVCSAAREWFAAHPNPSEVKTNALGLGSHSRREEQGRDWRALVLDEVPMWEVAVPEEVPVLYKILKGAMEGKL